MEKIRDPQSQALVFEPTDDIRRELDILKEQVQLLQKRSELYRQVIITIVDQLARVRPSEHSTTVILNILNRINSL